MIKRRQKYMTEKHKILTEGWTFYEGYTDDRKGSCDNSVLRVFTCDEGEKVE